MFLLLCMSFFQNQVLFVESFTFILLFGTTNLCRAREFAAGVSGQKPKPQYTCVSLHHRPKIENFGNFGIFREARCYKWENSLIVWQD